MLLCVLIPASISAQEPTSALPAARDPQAIAAVEAAIAAFGSSAAAQSLRVQALVKTPDANGNITASTVVWEMAGPEFRIAWSDGSSTSVIVTGHGNPTASADGHSSVVPKHVVQAMFIPAFAGAILAREFQNPNYSLQYLGAETVDGTPCTAVRTLLSMDPISEALTDQIWYFSNATNLPIRVTYRSPADQTPLLSRPATVDLSNFTSVSGGLYPLNIIVSGPGNQVSTVTLQSASTNPSIPPTDFDVAAGGAQ
jgi:hypothetical protein